jgi:hypothetical protein
MSYILKDNPIVVNIELTNEGRSKLASGNFNVTKFAVGDSEINYNFNNKKNINNNLLNILSPPKNITDIRYKIKKNFKDIEYIYNTNISVSENETINCMNMGFFDGDDINNLKIKISKSFVKESKLKIDMGDINTGTPRLIRIRQSDNFIFTDEPEIGDFLLVNWVNEYNTDTNLKDGIISSDIYTPFIWYKIINITGSLSNNTLVVEVDKNLPNLGLFQSDILYSYCLLYPKGNSIKTYYGTEFLSDYWNFIDDEYIENTKCNVNITPVWSLNIIYPKYNIGFLENTLNPNIYDNYIFMGFLKYIENFDENKIIGIIHYTNTTPTNQIGEGFYKNEAELLIPTIMWYKNKDNKIGLKLKCDNILKRVENYKINYYNLIDDNNFIVGKCFNDLKIFVIEDQEILTAINYKSNRNWTLPPVISIINEVVCPSEDI